MMDLVTDMLFSKDLIYLTTLLVIMHEVGKITLIFILKLMSTNSF